MFPWTHKRMRKSGSPDAERRRRLEWSDKFVLRSLTLSLLLLVAVSASATEILPLDQVRPGMKGVGYTVFEADKVESFDVEILAILRNVLGPKQDIILSRLSGPRVNFTGVAGGMSGSPVYVDGKLVGALSLRLGIFAKEALAGITPIEQLLRVGSEPTPASAPALARYPFPESVASTYGLAGGAGTYFVPIETPLLFVGFDRNVIQRFAADFSQFGFSAVQGGSSTETRVLPPRGTLKPGDGISAVLVSGDLAIHGAGTVSYVDGDRVYAFGHPLLGFGTVQLPMARAEFVYTLASTMASTKIANLGETIGTLEQDRLTGIAGRLGPAPATIPVELHLTGPRFERAIHVQVAQHPKITALLIAVSALQGLAGNPEYGEGSTLRLRGHIQLRNHSDITLENMFAPSDAGGPDASQVAMSVAALFGRIFNNPFETPEVKAVNLSVEFLPRRLSAEIQNAWSDKSEVVPGEEVRIRVMLRPYRGASFVREVPITIPPQALKGELRILVSDGETLNRMPFVLERRLQSLEQLIAVLNRERRNDRLYVTLVQPSPTLLVQDKILPNVPLSEINVLDRSRMQSGATILRESALAEWSVPLESVITGSQSVTITVK